MEFNYTDLIGFRRRTQRLNGAWSSRTEETYHTVIQCIAAIFEMLALKVCHGHSHSYVDVVSLQALTSKPLNVLYNLRKTTTTNPNQESRCPPDTKSPRKGKRLTSEIKPTTANNHLIAEETIESITLIDKIMILF